MKYISFMWRIIKSITMQDTLKNKILILVISLLLVGVMILLYFIDDSESWTKYKINSCIAVNIWLFFILPSFREVYLIKREYFKNNYVDKSKFIRLAVEYSINRLTFPILFAPYFAIKYYFVNKKKTNE